MSDPNMRSPYGDYYYRRTLLPEFGCNEDETDDDELTELKTELAAAQGEAAMLRGTLERISFVVPIDCDCRGVGPHEQVLQMTAVARNALAQPSPAANWNARVVAMVRVCEAANAIRVFEASLKHDPSVDADIVKWKKLHAAMDEYLRQYNALTEKREEGEA